jgi:hypothetical protein
MNGWSLVARRPVSPAISCLMSLVRTVRCAQRMVPTIALVTRYCSHEQSVSGENRLWTGRLLERKLLRKGLSQVTIADSCAYGKPALLYRRIGLKGTDACSGARPRDPPGRAVATRWPPSLPVGLPHLVENRVGYLIPAPHYLQLRADEDGRRLAITGLAKGSRGVNLARVDG